jgi:hypothetical protein
VKHISEVKVKVEVEPCEMSVAYFTGEVEEKGIILYKNLYG